VRPQLVSELVEESLASGDADDSGAPPHELDGNAPAEAR
jgi:hypothetical protein